MLIYLAQLSHATAATVQNRCFPLPVGAIATFLQKELGEQVRVEVFKLPDELSAALAREAPDVLMLSNYLWNENLACAFAEEVKTRYPRTLVVMGGPNASTDLDRNVAFLRAHRAIDVLVLYEGEIASRELVRKLLATGSIEAVKRMAFPSTLSLVDGEPVIGRGEAETRVGMPKSGYELDDVPSPYLTGLFDKFFRDAEIPLIESTRGCPFTCAFCQQGCRYYTKVRSFSTERVRQEIDYIAEKVHRDGLAIHALQIADANFGMFERDREIVEAIRRTQDELGYPKHVSSSTGKNRPELIIENTFRLREGSMPLRSAMQSMNPATLRAIRRQNIRPQTYQVVQREMDRRGLENVADLMLGLPHETLETHAAGIYELVDMGIKEFACLQTIVLKGTELENPQYQREHGIETKYRVIPECIGDYDVCGTVRRVVEFEPIIVATRSMSFDDYLAARRLHLLVMIYHNTRLLAPAYEFLGRRGIPKSSLMKALAQSGHSGLERLMASFLEDTRHELLDRPEDLAGRADLDELTANKIFRYLAIALVDEPGAVAERLRAACRSVAGPGMEAEIGELGELLEASIVSPLESPRDRVFPLRTAGLAAAFGAEVRLVLTDKQRALIDSLNRLYPSKAEKINKLAYHLRPANLARTIEPASAA